MQDVEHLIATYKIVWPSKHVFLTGPRVFHSHSGGPGLAGPDPESPMSRFDPARPLRGLMGSNARPHSCRHDCSPRRRCQTLQDILRDRSSNRLTSIGVHITEPEEHM